MKMMFAGLLFVALVAAVPTRPVVSENFEAQGEMRITPEHGPAESGLGQWALDRSKGVAVEHYEFPGGRIAWDLQRWDQGHYYSSDRQNCTVGKLTGNMPSTWGWLATATYNGTRQIGRIDVDVWQGTSNGVKIDAAFLTTDSTKPVYVGRHYGDGMVETFIRTFSTAPSQSAWFLPPPNCKIPAPAEPEMKFFNDTKKFGCPQYAMYKQCDPAWARQELGRSSNTICSAGCAMSSTAMYLTTRGHSINPSGLNQWLDSHGGYVGGDELVWGSVNAFGVAFQGIENPSEAVVADGIAQCHGLIANVRGGTHWVLLTGHPSPGVFSVNDPGFNDGAYAFNTMLRFAVYH